MLFLCGRLDRREHWDGTLTMSVWFISRHQGAIEWARLQEIEVDHWVTHLVVEDISTGDIVIGTLPVQLAFEVCMRGACYKNLSLDLPFERRGKELSADDLFACGARLEEYVISSRGEDIC